MALVWVSGVSLQLKEPGHQGLEDPVRGALVDSPLDDRSLTPPARQGTKEGPTPSPPEVTALHQCRCGLPGRGGRRGTSARGGASSPYPRGSPPPRPGRPRAGRHGLRRRERPSRRPRRRRHPRQRRGASRPAVADLDAVVARLPGVRPQPGRGVRPEPRGHVLALSPPRPERGVVGLDRVSIGPGVMFLSALGEPVHFPATDVIRRPLGTLAGGHFDASFSNAAR